jgi:hypothetical protein
MGCGGFKPPLFGRPNFFNAFYFAGVSNPLYFEVDILNLQDY